MTKSNCNSIDWKRVSDHAQKFIIDGDTKMEVLHLLDTISDIICNGEDVEEVNGTHTVNWFNSNDIRWVIQSVIPSWHNSWFNKVFTDALEYTCRTIPMCKYTKESLAEEIERRKTNPYPGCYGYTYVYGVH